jgi:hypothetical protein
MLLTLSLILDPLLGNTWASIFANFLTMLVSIAIKDNISVINDKATLASINIMASFVVLLVQLAQLQ